MEESEILENQNVPQTDKMKPASAHGEHNELYILNYSHSKDSNESLGRKSLEQKNFNAVKKLQKQQSHVYDLKESQAQEQPPENIDQNTKPLKSEEKLHISRHEEEYKDIVSTHSKESREQCQEEARIETLRIKYKDIIIDNISDDTISAKSKPQSQVKLNDAAPGKTLSMDNARKSNTLIEEEPLNNPKEEAIKVVENVTSPPETPAKEELQETKEQDTIPKPEEVRIDELDQMAPSTSSAAQETKSEKPNEATPCTEIKFDPRDKIRQDMEEYFKGIQALEVKTLTGDELNAREAEAILREEQQRKTWKGMLLAVAHTSLSTSTNSSSSGKTPKSAVQAILQRTAKAEFKRKMYVLKENYNYRLELLKQLKNDMKNNYKSEAQQLYIDYHSIKNQTLNSPPLNEIDTVCSTENSNQEES
ncbi:uncharacterized protein PFB0765w isoform X3 [Drosophila yakuba]|uniref:Uncharacterized protein, isoform A n=1 Tax=Drosophila yakuba TaxID=7245 RepID=B4P0R4_DROYA|nr:uncharacterized protein PFB0765w isoform X3 [Drosophila yakuba]EDW87959.2 uncharacterized protein Dyak_GE13528, isoform A [Drosophila yakuba]